MNIKKNIHVFDHNSSSFHTSFSKIRIWVFSYGTDFPSDIFYGSTVNSLLCVLT